MKVGVIGLGRMGSAIAQRLVDTGYEVIGFDNNPQAVASAREQGVVIVKHLEEVAKQARVIWLSLPAGDTIDHVIKQLAPEFKKADVLIDAGNSHFTDSQRRAQCLAQRDINFLDCGISGGLQGRGHGFCLMIGGDQDSYFKVEAILAAVAATDGVAYLGSSGAGHYVKMVHNAIEYGVMQAYAEGIQLMHEGTFAKELDLAKITALWNHGSLIRSWMLELIHRIVERDEELKNSAGTIDFGKTALWASDEARHNHIPLPVINQSIAVRKESQKAENYATKLIALLRHEFGGHAIHKKEEKE